MKFIAFLTLLCLTISVSCDIHAVLVAGSSGFWNYRHQADICHAYQTLISKGVSADNIIVMAYDDIATASDNPFPGKIFNKPTYSKPGVDVYAGCKIDYTGSSVNSKNYLAIIQGNAAGVTGGNGRVLKSTQSDRVFLNFADHGATGLIAFPSDELYADDLLAAFQSMYDKKMYKQLVYYLEACESGSMFQKLKNGLNLYATSAASPTQSSWGTYCNPDDKVDGKHLGTCLGDLYSVNWMENTDKIDTGIETLLQQYDIVKNLTKSKSQVMQWGDLSFDSEAIGDFQGEKSQKGAWEKLQLNFVKEQQAQKVYGMLDSRDIKLNYLQEKYLRTQSKQDEELLQAEIEERKFFDQKFASFQKSSSLNLDVDNILAVPEIENWACLKSAVGKFGEKCKKFSDYGLKYVKVLAFACHNGKSQADVLKTIEETCN